MVNQSNPTAPPREGMVVMLCCYIPRVLPQTQTSGGSIRLAALCRCDARPLLHSMMSRLVEGGCTRTCYEFGYALDLSMVLCMPFLTLKRATCRLKPLRRPNGRQASVNLE